ncbi:hypothetical protein EMN47_06255 [Prolixibacteraceae bacterium JC049]|nr:hypothetical protein [Prolixibacteraceae bacterium JC049]
MKYSQIIKITSVLFLAVMATSCVSKKKFLAMQDGKLRAEKRVAALTDELDTKKEIINTMHSDFNRMKNELLTNNAMKDSHIDSLARQVVNLKGNVSETNANLEEKLFAFKYEKRRYMDNIKQLEEKNVKLQGVQKQLNENIKEMEDKLTEERFETSKERDEKNRLVNQLTVAKNEIKQVKASVEKLKTQINGLKQKMADKDQEISRLRNNVKLLKKNIGK